MANDAILNGLKWLMFECMRKTEILGKMERKKQTNKKENEEIISKRMGRKNGRKEKV